MNPSTTESTAYTPMTGVGVEELPPMRRLRSALIVLVGRVVALVKRIDFDGRRIKYVVAPYNLTCANERCLELGIIQASLPSAGRVLEIGNVWGHYRAHDFEIVDKYEIAPGVQNLDVVEIPEDDKYDFVFSVSTFEHVGWDEDPREPEKLGAAFEKIPRLLKPGGKAIITVPIDWNEWLDEQLAKGTIAADRIDWYVRDALFCGWRVGTSEEALAQKYGERHPAANAVAIIQFTA